ncbi:MAG: thiopurine S-methyltransferase [Alphaproteobacteria bacterium]|nr:MAG: thiopurine S-methyltransferase [Alphaproteobacteria bacterium]
MQREFWLERWDRQEIGFHQQEINPYLQEFWGDLHLSPGCEVFVPLCGKSRDMIWLKDHGHKVLGIELSELAVETFFRENGHAPARRQQGKFAVSEAGGMRLFCGDFFDLGAEDLKGVRAVYDRAALIALPPELRERYVRHSFDILPAEAPILLITLEYPGMQMPGPPFSVSADEVKRLYGAHADIRLLKRVNALGENPKLAERGLSQLHENVFLIRLR